jgi:dihydropteroate synthase
VSHSVAAPNPTAGADPAPSCWSVRGRSLTLARPAIMGIVNVTPDSFSDGGRYREPQHALRHAERLVSEGAALLDVGGESTRPGAAAVDAREEIRRVLPVVRLLRANLAVPISVDTRKAEVARAALDAGADIINDVSALGDPDMAAVVAEAGAGVVLMHMRGTPEIMQRDPSYRDVVAEVRDALADALRRAEHAGIPRDRIAVDPGIGFGKTGEHNLMLIQRLDRLAGLGCTVLLGPSRKAFLGTLLGGVPPERRAVGTAAACVLGLLRGARVFRVHDVRPVREALAVAEAIRTGQMGEA